MSLVTPQDVFFFALFREGRSLARCPTNDLLRLRATCQTARDQLDVSTFWPTRYAALRGAPVPEDPSVCKEACIEMGRRTSTAAAHVLALETSYNAASAMGKAVLAGAIAMTGPVLLPLHLPMAPVQGALVGGYLGAFTPLWAASLCHMGLGPQRRGLQVVSALAFVCVAPAGAICGGLMGAAAGAITMTLFTVGVVPVSALMYCGQSLMHTAQTVNTTYKLGKNACVQYQATSLWRATMAKAPHMLRVC